MTSNHSLIERYSQIEYPIQFLRRPVRLGVEYFIGLDLGQVRDHTAIAVLECAEMSIGRNVVTYEPLIVKRGSSTSAALSRAPNSAARP